jgi:hypothetical protein
MTLSSFEPISESDWTVGTLYIKLQKGEKHAEFHRDKNTEYVARTWFFYRFKR